VDALFIGDALEQVALDGGNLLVDFELRQGSRLDQRADASSCLLLSFIPPLRVVGSYSWLDHIPARCVPEPGWTLYVRGIGDLGLPLVTG